MSISCNNRKTQIHIRQIKCTRMFGSVERSKMLHFEAFLMEAHIILIYDTPKARTIAT